VFGNRDGSLVDCVRCFDDVLDLMIDSIVKRPAHNSPSNLPGKALACRSGRLLRLHELLVENSPFIEHPLQHIAGRGRAQSKRLGFAGNDDERRA
jgi:hypothetical protein